MTVFYFLHLQPPGTTRFKNAPSGWRERRWRRQSDTGRFNCIFISHLFNYGLNVHTLAKLSLTKHRKQTTSTQYNLGALFESDTFTVSTRINRQWRVQSRQRCVNRPVARPRRESSWRPRPPARVHRLLVE